MGDERKAAENVEFRPLEVRNPDFPSDGLYLVHAAVKLRLAGFSRAILLRSNEQQVPIGGSIRMPKAALGKVIAADPRTRTATIDWGSLNRIARGDQFEIRTGMGDFWKLWIGKVEETSAAGYLAPITKVGPNAMNPNPRFPTPGISAKLIRPGTR